MLVLNQGNEVDGRYEIVGTIGSGGFGNVYKAWQKQFERFVALKLLNTNMLEEADGAGRFEREAKVIAGLRHKNIVGFYGYGVWQNAPYMVMEFIEGSSLQTKLYGQSRLETLDAARIMRQVCEGLSCAHANGVIHRDLKPSNIMLEQGPDGRSMVKLIDFGLVKLMPGYGEANQKLTEAGCAVGTCYYMSPEQCIGGTTDHRADIYAAACIFYQCITGAKPFDKDDTMAVMYAHMNELPKPLSSAIGVGALTDALQAIINKGMAKEPDDRYQSALEMAADLDAILRGESGKLAQLGRSSQRLTLPPAAVAQAAKRRKRWLVPAICGLLTAGVAMTVAVNYFHRDTGPKIDDTPTDIFAEIAQRPTKPAPEEIPADVKRGLAEALTQYSRKHLPGAQMVLEELLASPAVIKSTYLQQLTSLRLAQVDASMNKSRLAEKAASKALALPDAPDPELRADLQEVLADSMLLQHHFANAHDIYAELLASGAPERRKRCLLGLARGAIYQNHLTEAEPYMVELRQILTPKQRKERTMQMLELTYAALKKDWDGVGRAGTDLLSMYYDHSEDTWNETVADEDMLQCQRAVYRLPSMELLKHIQDSTGVRLDEDTLKYIPSYMPRDNPQYVRPQL